MSSNPHAVACCLLERAFPGLTQSQQYSQDATYQQLSCQNVTIYPSWDIYQGGKRLLINCLYNALTSSPRWVISPIFEVVVSKHVLPLWSPPTSALTKQSRHSTFLTVRRCCHRQAVNLSRDDERLYHKSHGMGSWQHWFPTPVYHCHSADSHGNGKSVSTPVATVSPGEEPDTPCRLVALTKWCPKQSKQ